MYMNAKKLITKFIEDESGLVVVEYVIGAAGILVVLVLVFSDLGEQLVSKITSIFSAI